MHRHHHSHHSHGTRFLIDDIAYASKLRKISPTLKILFAFYSLLLCLISRTYVVSILILLLMVILMIAVGKTRWQDVVQLMRVPLAFIILGCVMILLQITQAPETMLWSVSIGICRIGISEESLHQFLQVFVQCLSAVSCMYFLSTSTPMTELFTTLRRLHLPGFLVEIMELVYRYIFVLMEIAAQIRTAQECRLGYATLKTGFYSMGQLISNLFSRAYHQAERTYTAMESRGYTDEVRTLGMQYQTKKWHYVGAGLISALLTGLVIVFQCL